MIQPLPEYFTQFHLNYNMNKYSYSLTEFLKKHQSAEGFIKPVAHAYVAEKSSAPKLKDMKRKKFRNHKH